MPPAPARSPLRVERSPLAFTAVAALVVACGGQIDGSSTAPDAALVASPTDLGAMAPRTDGATDAVAHVAAGFPVAATAAAASVTVGPYAIKKGQPLVLAAFQDWAGAADFSLSEDGAASGHVTWKTVERSTSPFTGTLTVYSGVADADLPAVTTRVRSTVPAGVVSTVVVALDGASGALRAASVAGTASPIAVSVDGATAGALVLGFGAIGFTSPTPDAGATLIARSPETLGWDVWAESASASAAGPVTLGLTNATAGQPWAMIAVAVPPAGDRGGGAPDAGADGQDGATIAPDDAGTDGATGTVKPSSPSFGCWAWGKPDVGAIVHAGFQWFESGYPGTLSPSENQALIQAGAVPFAYINMAEVPNDDVSLQGQIGPFYKDIVLCQNGGWNTSVVDVRDPRWQAWLVRRAGDAYAAGNRGIKWDVAGVENLCNGWSAQGGAAAQKQAVDAMAGVLAQVKQQHADMKFILNQGFALAQDHASLVDGFELENMINYLDAHPGDQWAMDQIATVSAIHASGIPILDLEYIDLFGCADTTCAYANRLYDQIVALGWVPYITQTHMNIEGRGLGITVPW